MAKRTVGFKGNYTGFQHFQEMAVKTLNEIYGRVKPFDTFDFSEEGDNYIAVGYYDGEEPAEVKAGEKLTDAEVAARDAIEVPTEEEIALAAEVKELQERMAAATQENPVSYVDLKRAAELFILKAGPEEDAKVYTLADVLGASDAAIALAEQYDLDVRLVTGTGSNGNVKVDDVKKHIKENNLVLTAPDKENADGNGIDNQPNA